MESKQENKSDFSLLKRVLAVARPHSVLFTMSLVLAVVITPFSIAQPFIVQQMVDDNILGNNTQGLISNVVLFIVTLVIHVLLKYIFIYVTALLGQSVIRDMRISVFQHITGLRLRFFDQTPVGTTTTRTINDIEAINNVFAQGVITIVADFITLLAVVGVMLYTSWQLTLIVFLTMPFMILASYVFKEKVKVSFKTVRAQIASMNAFLQERISGMKIVQLLHAEKQEEEKFRVINRNYTSANLDSVFYYAVFFPVVELISAIALALMIWWGARGYLQDSVSFGALVAFPLYLNLMFRPIRFMADKFNTLQMGLVAAERVFKILDNHDVIADTGDIEAAKIKGDIAFEDVCFSYDGVHPILTDVSFSIEAGKMLAIVGSTGSGKSTIINILGRFYEISSGRVLIDGVDIEKYSIKNLRSKIAIVLQDVFLFEGSVLENITLRDVNITEETVNNASRIMGAHDFIENLPGGYQFKISERGTNLSAGQRQLISFVRALVSNPDILILDEATSSIDTESELVIQRAIEKLIQGRTSIVIAHRLSTIQHAHKILVMSGGRIIESGDHESLLSDEDGQYRKLYEMQFSEVSAVSYV
jgi:ATP-binding cassette subfamily B multidrug efflux pump